MWADQWSWSEQARIDRAIAGRENHADAMAPTTVETDRIAERAFSPDPMFDRIEWAERRRAA
jgi:hypothetical protein